MKNHKQHGYTPAKGFLTKVLSNMIRFHDVNGIPYEELPEDLLHSGPAIPGNLTNPINLPLKYADSDTVETQRTKKLRLEDPSVVINGTPVIRASLPAMMTPTSLYGKRIRFSILEYDPLMDSSNMTMKDWAKIATDIEVNYHLYDAFLILHGTDTMAYTASALSFMLEDLGKTVILTGSQVFYPNYVVPAIVSPALMAKNT
jgi:lysophospholipase